VIVVEYRPDFRGMAEFLRGPDAARVTAAAAGVGLARMRGLVGHDSGETARSGRLLHGTGGRRNDRVRTTIAFDGAMVQQQFGNRRTRATRPMTRAWEQI
jgi:hypothetical protein